jgi:hypothetical protein
MLGVKIFQMLAVLDVSFPFSKLQTPSILTLTLCPVPYSTQKANGIFINIASSCLSALQTSPACADNSWSLWNATQGPYQFGFFCCLATQAGLNSGGCIEASQVPAYIGQIGGLVCYSLPPSLH